MVLLIRTWTTQSTLQILLWPLCTKVRIINIEESQAVGISGSKAQDCNPPPSIRCIAVLNGKKHKTIVLTGHCIFHFSHLPRETWRRSYRIVLKFFRKKLGNLEYRDTEAFQVAWRSKNSWWQVMVFDTMHDGELPILLWGMKSHGLKDTERKVDFYLQNNFFKQGKTSSLDLSLL